MTTETQAQKQQLLDEIEQKEEKLEELEDKSDSFEYDIAHIKTLNERDDKKAKKLDEKISSKKEYFRSALITFGVGVLAGLILFTILRLR